MASNRFVISLAVLALFLSLAGCGFVPSQWSCDARPTRPECVDFLDNPNNHLSVTFENLCSLGDGTYSDELCDHSGALGGCLCEGCENGRNINWFFPGALDGTINTADDVRAECEAEGHEFVEP